LQAALILMVLIGGVVAVYLVSQSFAPAVAGDSAQFDRNSSIGSEILQTKSPATKTVRANSESVESANPLTTSTSSLPTSYQLSVTFGDIGPQLLAAGAIDYNRFVQTYERSGQALGEEELSILANGSAEPVIISQKNAYFLLNFFWALGLTNKNPLLDEGPLMQYSEGDVGRFASTGGWSLGQVAATELYSSEPLLTLTLEQQALLERVASNVYRPCCNNHTAFADCNHGMAMLGLLELMAGQGTSEDEMFKAAKQVNSFWFPQQASETAEFFQVTMELDYADVDGRMAVGPEVFSGSGFRSVHQWLASNGQLEQAPKSGSSCGV
jgi:hypothetical protein